LRVLKRRHVLSTNVYERTFISMANLEHTLVGH
jgi:hypothetical protein